MIDQTRDLRKCLGQIQVRAWRLHLETPDVCATVPMLRGVWGAALHEVDRALYARLFVGGAEEQPRYLLRPAPAGLLPAPAVEFVVFGSLDSGEAVSVWSAWSLALARGLGVDRVPARLTQVRALVSDGSVLHEELGTRHHPGFDLDALVWPTGGDACRLVCSVPLRLLRKKRLITNPALPDLIIGALRRVHAFGGGQTEHVWAQRADWLQLARQHPATPEQWEPMDLIRYSGRQLRELEMRGVVGAIQLPAGPGLLEPLLAAARWLHLGKGTVVGLGQLDVESA